MFSFDTVPIANLKATPSVASSGRVFKAPPPQPHHYPMAMGWSKPSMQRVTQARTQSERWHEAHLATLEAVVRRLVRRGWTRTHTSTHQGNKRATSRYLNIGSFRVRISDHPLSGRWRKNSYIVTDEVVKKCTVDDLVRWIEEDQKSARGLTA